MKAETMAEEVQDELEELASALDVSVDDVIERFEERVETFMGKKMGDIAESEVPEIALSSLRSDVISEVRVEGETETIPILSLGNQGIMTMRGSEVLKAAGIINPQQGGLVNKGGKADPPGLAIILCDEAEGADLGRMRQQFFPLATLEGTFTRRLASEIQSKGLAPDGSPAPVYLLETTSKTDVQEKEIEQLPDTREQKRGLINNQYITQADSFTLSDFEEHISATNPNGFPVGYGADIKRIRGHVIDVKRDDEKDYGLYVLVDDSVADTGELEDSGLDTGRRGQKLGLRAWVPPEQAIYGKQSVVEAYGVLQENGDGKISMSAYGIVPIVKFDIDEEDAVVSSGTASAEDEGVVRESI